MKKAVLCGHTGSNNRGCEAIIRSTQKLLADNGVESVLGTYAKNQDEKVGLDKALRVVEYQGYKNKLSLSRIYNGLVRKLLKDDMPTEKFVQKNIFGEIKNSDCALLIGGDTYCYTRPVGAYCMNRFAKKAGKKTVFWSCSVEKDKITPEMAEDLKRYDFIFPRENLTMNALLECGVDIDKMFLMSDSAFVLPCEEVELPEGFDNVLAYNPSFTIHRVGKNVNENREYLIEKLIENTDLKIAFIPHVYDTNFGDVIVCKELYEKYKHTGRVFLFDGIYNCMQLKFIISKCRFLIAERTHASIAGYSTCVPTFVLGYSVKSLGLATDIFGKTENYVYPSSELEGADMYYNKVQYLIENGDEIREHLEKVMPEYIGRAVKAGEKLAEILDR